MFRGIHEITLDAKGRLSVPAKLRAIFEEKSDGKMIMTADLDRNLMIYTLPEWEQVEAKLSKLPSLDKRARQIQSLFMGYAEELTMDGTGRVLIPPPLRKYAGLEKKITLIGMINKLHLWDSAAWEAKREQDVAELMGEGVDLGEALENLSI